MKTKKIVIISLTVLVGIMVITSGFMKVIHLPWSYDALVKQNLGNAATAIGLMEMAFAALFIFPKTMRIGFFLLCAYFGGAMATELSNGGSMLNPTVPLALIWVTAFLRDRELFLSTLNSDK